MTYRSRQNCLHHCHSIFSLIFNGLCHFLCCQNHEEYQDWPDSPFVHSLHTNNHVEYLKEYLEQHVDVGMLLNSPLNRHDSKSTPLHAAVFHNADEVVKVLLHHGARVHGKVDEKGRSTVHWAAICGNDACLRMLVHAMMREILEEQGKKIVDEKEFRSIRCELHEKRTTRTIHPLDLPDRHGYTALHHACRGGHTSCMKVLLQCGASQIPTSQGRRPIDIIGRLDTNCVKVLLRWGSEIPTHEDVEEEWSVYPLLGGGDVYELLRKCSADENEEWGNKGLRSVEEVLLEENG